MADTKIVAFVLGGLLLWGVLLVASYNDTDAEVPQIRVTNVADNGDGKQTN